MFAHQEQPAQDHPIFGRLAPHGIDGWSNQYSTEFTFDGKSRQLSVDYFVQEPDLIVFQENFVALSSTVESIAHQFLTFQLADLLELDMEPNEWDGLVLDLTIADTLYSTGLHWFATGAGGPSRDAFQLFFEGLELKGIVPDWNDPVHKGFENW